MAPPTHPFHPPPESPPPHSSQATHFFLPPPSSPFPGCTFFQLLLELRHLIPLSGAGAPGIVWSGRLIQRALAAALLQMQACRFLRLWLTLCMKRWCLGKKSMAWKRRGVGWGGVECVLGEIRFIVHNQSLITKNVSCFSFKECQVALMGSLPFIPTTSLRDTLSAKRVTEEIIEQSKQYTWLFAWVSKSNCDSFDFCITVFKVKMYICRFSSTHGRITF